MMIDHAFNGAIEFIHEGTPATRFYFPLNTVAPVSPTTLGTWNDTSQATYRKLETFKVGTTTGYGSLINNGAGISTVDRVYVSDPLRAQTLSLTTVKMQLQSLSTVGGNDTISQLNIRTVNNDGTALREELLATNDYGGGTFFFTSQRNKTYADGDSLKSTITIEDGDRLVIVIGYYGATVDLVDAKSRYGNPASIISDLPEDETQTASGVGWIEFSNAIQMY